MTVAIETKYRAMGGEIVHASRDALAAVEHALGLNAKEAEDPVEIAWNGRIKVSRKDVIELEDGESFNNKGVLPFGYHKRHVKGKEPTLIISAPAQCYKGEDRTWGLFAPLYGVRRTRKQAIGDFADLQALMEWVAELGGDYVATLPLSASLLRTPFDPSPYAPASRLFWNELYLHMQSQSSVLSSQSLIDYKATAQAKRAHLEPVAQQFFAERADRSPQFREYLKLYPDARAYAQFRAAGEKFNSGWPAWPKRARNGRLTRADYDETAMQYHLYAQYAAHTQLRSLAAGSLYLDLPLGVHPDSYDTWRNQGLFVAGVSVGAPPDQFFTEGQNWAFPPLNPVALRAQQYGYWRKVLQTQLRYASVLRLDHVMSLHRLYFVPDGFKATEGVYVNYPAEEMYAVLALESVRNQAIIVGEDLGTVPDEVRRAMDKHGVKRMFVLQFEGFGDVPAGAVASLNTHDMPPFAQYWQKNDPAKARDKALRFIARSPAQMVLVNLEDLWLETAPQNVPGTTENQQPNWRRRLKYTLEEMRADPNITRLLKMVDKERN